MKDDFEAGNALSDETDPLGFDAEKKKRMEQLSKRLLESEALAPYAERARAAGRMFEELMALPARQRHKAICEERFRNLDFAGYFVDESQRLEKVRRGHPEELAWLGGQIAAQGGWGEDAERGQATLAQACSVEGDARRQRGDWLGAEERFQTAFAALPRRPSNQTHGLFFRHLGQLRADQERLDEAAALLTLAATIYREDSDHIGEGVCLNSLGFIALQRNDPGRAMEAFAKARSLIQPDILLPFFSAAAEVGMAACLAVAGCKESARRMLGESLLFRCEIPDPYEEFRLDWFEGRIEIVLGDLAMARLRLKLVRDTCIRQGRLVEAGLCAIDLALAHAYGMTGGKLRKQALDLGAFPISPEKVRTVRALEEFLREARRPDADLEAAARRADRSIRPGLAFVIPQREPAPPRR